MAGNELTFTVNHTAPNAFGSIALASGGSWATKTISFRIVAWATAAETDADNAGIRRSVVTAWNNVSVSAGQKLTINFTLGENVNHYAFYYQEAATFNPALVAKKCTATFTYPSASLGTCVVLDDDDTATFTFGAEATSVEVDPVIQLAPTVREMVVRGYNGKLVKKSYAQNTMVDSLDVVLSMHSSVTPTDNKLLLKWVKNSTPLLLSESLTGTAVFITSYTGRLVNTDYIHSKHKNANETLTYVFAVETET